MMKRPADKDAHLDLGMRPWSAGAVTLAAALALAACDSGASESGPGGVSEGEARALDEAAEMLDEQQLPNDAVPETDLPVAEPAEGAAEAPAEGTGEGGE